LTVLASCPRTGLPDPNDTTVYDSIALTTKPELLRSAVPHYPDELRQAGIAGRTVVDFIIDARGRVDTASIKITEATDPAFGRSTTKAIASSQWCPGTIGDRPVRARRQQIVNYKIAGSPG
jgi:protein TonB